MAEPTEANIAALNEITEGYSAAAFASLRSHLKASEPETDQGPTSLDMEPILRIVRDHIPPAIGPTREYQRLQALVNCTRRSLLPFPDEHTVDVDAERDAWLSAIRRLEAEGVR